MTEQGELEPPSDVVAEATFLGALMLSPDALDDALDRVTIAELYRPAHQAIYAAIVSLHADGNPVDPISVAHRLDATGDLTRCGGVRYVRDLVSATPAAANWPSYAQIITEKATKRNLVTAGARIVQLGHCGGDASEAVDLASATLDALTDHRVDADGPVTLDRAVEDAFERLAGPVPPTISTGLYDVDEVLTGGLMPGDVTVIAARPGGAKSLTGANIGLNVALSGATVLLCSLEMKAAEITSRVLANDAGIEHTSILRHRLNDFDWRRLEKTQDRLRGIPFHILDTPNLTVAGLRRHAKRVMHRPDSSGLIVVDYAQLMTPADPRLPREQQVSAIGQGCKELAMDLDAALILISQTNRKDDANSDPNMSTLRESGSLEAVASVVIILRRPKELDRAGEIDVHIVKNRHGREGAVSLAYSPHYARVRSLLRTAS